jgi:cell division initiation protein
MDMSITAAEIQNVRFSEASRGYNPDQVDEFLERVANDVDALNRAIAEAAARVSEAEQRAELAEQMANAAPIGASPAFQADRNDSSISEDVIARAFINAQVSADNLREEARKEAEKLYREAEAKAKDYVSDAHTERSRILSELDYLREISERFRTEFISLVNHYTTDAQKRFADFAELVPEEISVEERQTIEDLLAANNAAFEADAASVELEVVAQAAAQMQAATLASQAAETTGSQTAVAATPADEAAEADTEPEPTDNTNAYMLDDDLEIEEID